MAVQIEGFQLGNNNGYFFYLWLKGEMGAEKLPWNGSFMAWPLSIPDFPSVD